MNHINKVKIIKGDAVKTIPKYLLFLLASPSYQITIQKLNQSSAQPMITQKSLKGLVIPLPTKPEQEQIVSQIEQGFSLIENTTQIIESTLQKLQTMKMSVLKQAFEGKLVPQDPNDEPASVLLEKIKSTKESQNTKQRRMKNVK